MLAETLMRQIFFGESRGVGIMRTLQGQHRQLFANTPLDEELGRQIGDEVRHARSYARLLAKRTSTRPSPVSVDAGWEKIFGHISAARSFSTTLIGIYGLMEPFNLLSINTFLLPLLDRDERAEVAEIARDEARHIGMFDLFGELVERRVLGVVEAEALEMIRVFLEALKDGIALPSGERVSLPRGEWKQFMKHAAEIRTRIAGWGEPAAARS